MDLLFIANTHESDRALMEAAEADGHRIMKRISCRDGLSAHVNTLHPDAVVIVVDTIDHSLLRDIRKTFDNRPLPMLAFTEDARQQSIDAAFASGMTSYIVDDARPGRFDVLLKVANARFNEVMRLRQELEDTRKTLQERKFVERAKGIIMKQKRLSEEQAYRAMQKLAMDRNKRLGEIAEQIIAASEVLV